MFTILANDQKQYGPATTEQLRQWILSERVNQSTLAKSDSQTDWKPLGEFPEFASLFLIPEPPPLLSAAPLGKRSKYSLMLGPMGPMTRDRAWVCLTTNLSLPGFGSIFGRRKIGYAQIIFTLASFALTTTTGLTTMAWFHANQQRLQQSEDGSFGEVWDHLRWPLLGITFFGIAFLWALMTSLSLLHESRRYKKDVPAGVPPRI